jgi:1-hydroxycarotenoid 3,4-desaturase
MLGARDLRVIVVGAGIGGLACTLDLARQGARVLVLERAARSGGKVRTATVAGREVPMGPTVLTMPWVFEELFDDAGASFPSEVELSRCEVLARHTWRDGTTFDLFADDRRSADAIGRVFGATAERQYRAFAADNARIFEIADEHFLRGPRMTMAGVVRRFGLAGLTTLPRLDAHRTMWRALTDRFDEPRLRQVFGRYATYTGSSPFEAPATLNLIAHVESQGVYVTRHGLGAVAQAMEARARALGAEFQHGVTVERIVIEGGRATGVIANGQHHRADAVVFNGDVNALGTGLVGDAARGAVTATNAEDRSLSAVTWAMVASPIGQPLVHHNVFFSDDYPAEWDDVIARKRTPSSPTVYVCAHDRANGSPTSADEALLVIVNAPATGDHPERWSEKERERCTTTMTSVLEACRLKLRPTEQRLTTPVEFEQAFPGTGGALYGRRSKGPLAAFAREGSRTKLPGLYLTGGCVHPGPGVPMVALSGRLACEAIVADRASIVSSRTTAISGTTSTPSAQTASSRSS